jgi:hypothetical protein
MILYIGQHVVDDIYNIYSLCEIILDIIEKLSSGGVHASNYMKQIIIIRQASE